MLIGRLVPSLARVSHRTIERDARRRRVDEKLSNDACYHGDAIFMRNYLRRCDNSIREIDEPTPLLRWDTNGEGRLREQSNLVKIACLRVRRP